jgi:predicted small secreted protein
MQTDSSSKYVDPGAAALKWSLFVIFALMCAISLTGCNTVRGVAGFVKGVATDIEAAADGIQHQMAETDQ